ncbi:MAG: hypothetical protein M3544_01160 [Pseudomonadota bacterium]|nr:hypothetical protein [Pseudomonadota bacterium]
MEFTIDADEEFLRVKVSGRESDKPPSHLCAAIFSESSRLGRTRILIELDQKTPLSPTSQYDLISRLPQIGFTPQHKIALVHKAAALQQANQFIDVVAENRGLRVRNFPGVDDAESWLREGPAE